jgi:hypothetical protein
MTDLMPAFKHCKHCGSPLIEKQWRKWLSKYRYYKRKEQRICNGPFCSNGCRANWQMSENDRQYQQEHVVVDFNGLPTLMVEKLAKSGLFG